MRTSSVIQPVLLVALDFSAQRVLAEDERGGVIVSLHS
jgi:hypothetical protein